MIASLPRHCNHLDEKNMLLVLMYHQIYHPTRADLLTKFEQHLQLLKEHYALVTPGEMSESSNTLSVCLCFDDAYFDFYHFIFPLLKKWEIKALLAIPTQFILNHTQLSPELRLEVGYPSGLEHINAFEKAALCTWEELQTMVASGWVLPASHSHSHPNLTHAEIDLQKELSHSKYLLETRLATPVESLVYPFGQMNASVQTEVLKQYRYGFRIGTALNRDWNHPQGLIYRVDADIFWKQGRIPSRTELRKYKFKNLLNKLRNK